MRDSLCLLNRILKYIGQYRKKYFLALFMVSLFSFIFNLIIAGVLKRVFAAVIGRQPGKLGIAIAVYVLSMAGLFIYNGIARYLFVFAVENTTGYIRKLLFAKVCSYTLSGLEDNHSGDLISRLTSDVLVAQGSYAEHLRIPAMAIISGVASGVVIFLKSWQMGIVIITTGILHLLNLLFIKYLKDVSNKIQKEISKSTEVLSDILAGNQTIRLYNAYQWQIAKYEQMNRSLLILNIKRTALQSALICLNIFIGISSYLIIMVIGSWMAVEGYFTFPDLLFITQMRNGLNVLFVSIGDLFTRLQTSLAGTERIFEVLDTAGETDF